MTLEERIAKRAEIIQRWGADYTLPESFRDEVVDYVHRFWRVTSEEFTTHRLTLWVVPLVTVSTRNRYDAETYLMRHYGNPPFNYGTDFTAYRLSFVLN